MKTVVAWAIAAAAGLVLLAACGGGDWPPVVERPPVVETEEPAATTPGPERADVPRLRCGTLMQLTDKDIEEALGEEGTWLHGQGEVCTKELVTDERFFVRMEPGAPGDFEPGAELLGVPGEAVSAVGDDARWFGGTGAEGGGASGILSVRQSTSVGALHFRIGLGRPDLSSADQLDIAKELALGALPLFPGVEQPEPEVVTFEREEVDRSNASFVDNLLAKELEGEWTRGEGLVATLSLFAGEVDAGQVLRHPELLDHSGTGAIRMAREYLEDGADAEAKTEIARLLEHLVLSRERLEGMAGIGQPTAALGVQAISVDTAQAADDCGEHWGAPSPCLVVEAWPEVDEMLFEAGKYRIWFPIESVRYKAGWKNEHFNWALQAMKDSAWTYEPISAQLGGKMPTVDIYFTPFGGPLHAATDDSDREHCFINLHAPMQQDKKEEHFKQRLAGAMAYCMIAGTFPQQTSMGYEVYRWWADGLAIWLSTVVGEEKTYAKANLEWKTLPHRLAAVEVETTLLDRNYENWLFFEHVEDIQWESFGSLDLVSKQSTKGGRAAQEKDLANYEGIDNLLHKFAEGLTDESIPDSGGGMVPYNVRVTYTHAISGPTTVLEEPQPFGVLRMHFVVDPGKYACVEYEEEGELRSSWRTGKPGAPGGSWSDDLPESLQGEAMFVVTTTEEKAVFTVKVTDVDDDPECEDEEDESVPTPCPLEIGCPRSKYYPPED